MRLLPKDALIRTPDGGYVTRHNVRGVLTVTMDKTSASAFQLTPAFVDALCDWRERYSIPWSLEPTGDTPIPPTTVRRYESVQPRFSTLLPCHASNVGEWAQLAEWMLDRCGMGFHPDTDAGDYVEPESGRKLFDPEFAHLVLQPMLEEARHTIDETPLYDVAMDCLQKRFPEIGADLQGI